MIPGTVATTFVIVCLATLSQTKAFPASMRSWRNPCTSSNPVEVSFNFDISFEINGNVLPTESPISIVADLEKKAFEAEKIAAEVQDIYNKRINDDMIIKKLMAKNISKFPVVDVDGTSQILRETIENVTGMYEKDYEMLSAASLFFQQMMADEEKHEGGARKAKMEEMYNMVMSILCEIEIASKNNGAQVTIDLDLTLSPMSSSNRMERYAKGFVITNQALKLFGYLKRQYAALKSTMNFSG